MEKLLNGYQTACNNCKIKINSAKYASFALIEKFGEPKKFYAPSPILERSKGHRESIKGRMPAKKGIVSLYIHIRDQTTIYEPNSICDQFVVGDFGLLIQLLPVFIVVVESPLFYY